ncbi:MAG: cysteine hydrolase [Verrucomicrobiae bacterium]|nr:cysteine hydrolase [Verrucomicrobiae bacterium]
MSDTTSKVVRIGRCWKLVAAWALLCEVGAAGLLAEDSTIYRNTLTPIAKPSPILADYPEFVAPVTERARFLAPCLVSDRDASLAVRAWRWSYNARGIVEMENLLDARQTAVVVVHPWGIDDARGWRTPEPAGAAFFCTPEKNRLVFRHAATVVNPFLKRLRASVRTIAYSLPGVEDAIRRKLYRSTTHTPDKAERAQGAKELAKALGEFAYKGGAVPREFPLSAQKPVADYFTRFPGLDASDTFNGKGFWQLPIPVMKAIEVCPDDVVFYDGEGYDRVREFLKAQGVRHVLLAGCALDMCVKATTCGYENLCKDFSVFIVADATLATFPAAATPAHATQAAVCAAALNHLITQVSWIRPRPAK